MSISKTIFGTIANTQVYSYVLSNNKDLKAEILNYGGIIKRLIYKGTDVVLGRDNLSEYQNNSGYYGAVIGRNSNRIAGAEFELNGKTYKLAKNDKDNNLHGGNIGYNARVWEAKCIDSDEPQLILTLHSPDGEEGFPGNVDVKVTYTLTSDNQLIIHYEGTTDMDTVLNMTNHSYFNLNGHNCGTIDNHTLMLNSSFYTPNSEQCMPTGEVWASKGTAFDFTTPKTLKEGFESTEKQVDMFGGFDHNFILDGRGYRHAGTLTGDKTAIKMDVYTDLPGVQLYTGNALELERICKDGAVYITHSALCLETQAFPNCLKHSHFPGAILRKGEKYDTTTSYKFS